MTGGQKFSRHALPVVMLEGTNIPFTVHAGADLSGRFQFKDLHADLFTIIVYVPRSGECRQTVEVSRSLADSKKRIFVDIAFQPNLASKSMQVVTPSQLSISTRALKEYDEGNKQLGKRNTAEAIGHFKKATEIAPQFVEAWNTLGTLAYRTNQFALAEGYFRKAQKQDPNDYPSLVNLGGILLPQGKLQEALPLNISAVRIMPDDSLAHAQLGLNYYFLGNYANAEKYLKQAIALDPSHFSFPQLPLANIYLRKNDSVSALRLLEQFLTLHPDAKQAPAIRKQIEYLRLPGKKP